MTLLNTLLVRLKRGILLQLLQFDRPPFFASFTIRPVFQSSGMFSEVQVLQKNFERLAGVRDSSACSSSALSSSNEQAILLTQAAESVAIVIDVTTSVLPHDLVVAFIVVPIASIDISNHTHSTSCDGTS